jgi:hypothetical protein
MPRLLLILLLLFPAALAAQTAGKIEIVQDSRIGSLVEKHRLIAQNDKIHGWRIQIFFDSGTNSKNRAFAKKGLFLAKYPETGSYLTFQSPNYKVRVGDFRSRLDAEGFRQRIQGDFPDAFVVRDEIAYPTAPVKPE